MAASILSIHSAQRGPHPARLAERIVLLDPRALQPSSFSLEIYGEAELGPDDLLPSIQQHGLLVPLVVAVSEEAGSWTILSGHRRWRCALSLGLGQVPCIIREVDSETAHHFLVLDYNQHRQKSFSQLMREADVLERLLKADARYRRLANLRPSGRDALAQAHAGASTECRISDTRITDEESTGAGLNGEKGGRQPGRVDTVIARRLGLGGKDRYRQARAVWQKASTGDVRARASVAQLDTGVKTIHAAYKDLRRRARFTAGFKPTPYDVWSFRHNGSFGIPHPGSTPPGVIAHLLHYFTPVDGLVVDPMAGGGTTLDVCEVMGRRCLAYDLQPARPDIRGHDLRNGFPAEASACDLVFCDPPYHTMLAASYAPESVSSIPLRDWIGFLHALVRHALGALKPGGYLAILLAPQTEKDLPPGHGYIDHTFLAYQAALEAGFLPERRISCPMSGGYLPQQVQQARREGRLLGQVRDLLVLRRPFSRTATESP